jgi:hypothetical protein
MIDKGRANADKIGFRVLHRLRAICGDLRLVSLSEERRITAFPPV